MSTTAINNVKQTYIDIINTLSINKSVLVIISLNIIVYLPLIIFLPDHLLDDYVIYGIISSVPNNFISLNPTDPYSLFLRPFSYFTFWLDFHLWPMMPLLMKLFSISFHLILSASLYFLIIELKKFFSIYSSNSLTIFVVIFFSFHPDNLKWIVWIANRTELLMICFYVLGLLFYFKFLNNKKNNVLLISLSLILFIISIASKQQSLHFPLLILFITYLNKKKIAYEKKKLIYVLFVFGFIVVVSLSVFNSLMYHEQTSIFFTNLWKKFFSLPGLLLYVINPFIGDYVYNFFLLNKIYVLILVVPFILAVYFLINRLSWKIIIITCIGYIIISLPRMIAHSGPRINSIHNLFFILLLGLILLLNRKKIMFYIIGILFVFQLLTSYTFYFYESKYIQLYDKRTTELSNIYDNDTYILVSKDPLVLQYQIMYHRFKRYGYSKLNILPIQYWELTFIEYSRVYKKLDIRVKTEKIILKTQVDNIILTINPSESPKFIFNPKKLETKNDRTDRGFAEISFNVLPEMDGKKLIYFNGNEWETVKDNNSLTK